MNGGGGGERGGGGGGGGYKKPINSKGRKYHVVFMRC